MDNPNLTNKRRRSPRLNKQKDVDLTALANVATVSNKPGEKDTVSDDERVVGQEDHSLVPRQEHEGNWVSPLDNMQRTLIVMKTKKLTLLKKIMKSRKIQMKKWMDALYFQLWEVNLEVKKIYL